MSELKLEVGKIYLNSYPRTIKIVHNAYSDNFVDQYDEDSFIFLGIDNEGNFAGYFDSKGVHYQEEDESLNLIKEHKEPYKATKVFYNSYDEDEQTDEYGDPFELMNPLDIISGLQTSLSLYADLNEFKSNIKEQNRLHERLLKITVITEEIE